MYYNPLHDADSYNTVSILRRWLVDEVFEQLGASVGDARGMPLCEEVRDPCLPVQQDAGSCGVLTFSAADCFSLDAPVAFSQQDIGVLRRRLALAFFFDDLYSAIDSSGFLSDCKPLSGSDSDTSGNEKD